MKKKYLLSLIGISCGIILLTGCGSKEKLVCTQSQGTDENGSTEIVATLEDDKVTKVEIGFVFESAEEAKEEYEKSKDSSMAKSFQLKLSGNKIIAQNGEKMFGGNFEDEEGTPNKKVIGMTKQEFIDEVEKTGFKCK